MVFLKLNQPGKVQKYNAAIAAQQRKTQPMRPGCAIGTRGGCWVDGECRNIEELVRKGERMPEVEGMGNVAVREEIY